MSIAFLDFLELDFALFLGTSRSLLNELIRTETVPSTVRVLPVPGGP